MLSELEWTAHQRSGVSHVFDLARDLVEVRFAVMPIQFRLRVEQVHLARTTIHKEVNDGLRFHQSMCWASVQVRRDFREQIVAKQLQQRGSVQPGADAGEKAAASGWVGFHSSIQFLRLPIMSRKLRW